MTARITPDALIEHNAVLRGCDLWDEQWDGRPLDSKAVVVISDTADRLDGLNSVLYTLALGERTRGGHGADRYVFMAKTIMDMRRRLKALEALYRAEWETEFEADVKAERAEKRKGKG